MAFNASTYTSNRLYNFEGDKNINISFRKIGLGANKAEVTELFPIIQVDRFENTTVDEIIKSLIPQHIFLQDKNGYNVKLKVDVGILDDRKGASSPFRPRRKDSSKHCSKLKKVKKVKSKSVKRSRKPRRQ
jgi:hypothetical protein